MHAQGGRKYTSRFNFKGRASSLLPQIEHLQQFHEHCRRTLACLCHYFLEPYCCDGSSGAIFNEIVNALFQDGTILLINFL